jgi:hypothetical protein
MTILQDNFAPLSAIYFDEEGVRVRLMRFERIEQIDGRAIPMRMTLIPEDKPGESTVVEYQNIAFGMPLDEAFFSLRGLQQAH